MPFHLFVYNDLSYSRETASGDASFAALLDRLEQALRDQPNVSLIEIGEQIEKLAAVPVARPFATTVAIGEAGARIARRLQSRTGWFPAIETIDVTRVEAARGVYRIPDRPDAEAWLRGISRLPLAIVDDTLYSGLTLSWVLDRLPSSLLPGTEAFFLQAIADALPAVRARCTVHTGLVMHGVPEQDVSIIKASHLFEAGAIRRTTGRDLAFFERPEWMRRWFPQGAAAITALCAKLAAAKTAGPGGAATP